MFKKSGFTLVEMMVVVIVIGILVTIAVPNYARSVERSKCSEGLSILKSIRTAALSFFANNETFSAALADLEDEVGANFTNFGANPDWTFDYAGGQTGYIATATRTGGHFSGTTITLSDDMGPPPVNEQWSDPAAGYPWDNPTW